MMKSMDPNKSVLEELLKYLEGKDGMDLSEAMKPKDEGLKVTQVEKIGDEGDQPDGDEMAAIEAASGADSEKPKMSEEEIDELIEAMQSKLG